MSKRFETIIYWLSEKEGGRKTLSEVEYLSNTAPDNLARDVEKAA